MQIVGVLILVVARSGEVDNALCIVHAEDIRHMPLALCNLVNKLTLSSVAVEVCPASALRPLDNLPIATNERRHLPLDRGIHLLLDDILSGCSGNIYHAEVSALDVAALADNIELIIVALPYHACGLLVAVSVHEGAVADEEHLLLILCHVHLAALECLGVEQLQPEVGALLARHLILILEQLGAILQDVDNPEVLEHRGVRTHCSKVL